MVIIVNPWHGDIGRRPRPLRSGKKFILGLIVNGDDLLHSETVDKIKLYFTLVLKTETLATKLSVPIEKQFSI